MAYRNEISPISKTNKNEADKRLTCSELVREETLGQILLKKNIITQTILDLALKRQRHEKGKYLGQILFEMGIPQSEINRILDHFDKRKPLGQILIDLNIFTPQQLEETLEMQKQLRRMGKRKPLGMLLLEGGYINPENSLRALSKHFNMPLARLGRFIPLPELQKAVGEKYARKNLIVVLENGLQRIKLALANPMPYIMEELQKKFSQKKVEFYLASPDEVDYCFRIFFDPFFLNNYR